MAKNPNKPKVVFFDLETLPDPKKIYNVVPSIGAWPGRTFKAELQSILCFGYKIQGEKKAKIINAWDLKGWNKDRHNDKQMVIEMMKVLQDADQIVTHNGKSFDLKVFNTRLAYHNLPPLGKVHHVDTKVVLKNKLSLYSNSLAEAAKFLGLDDKMPISNKWSMWLRFAFGDDTPSDKKLMADYCKQDVVVLEQLYDRILPHVGSAGVNRNQWTDGHSCPACGSENLQKHGTRMSRAGSYQRYMCTDCGTTSKTNHKDKNPAVL